MSTKEQVEHDAMLGLMRKLGMDIKPGMTRAHAGEMMSTVMRRLEAGDPEVVAAISEMKEEQAKSTSEPQTGVLGLNQDCKHSWFVTFRDAPKQEDGGTLEGHHFQVLVTTRDGASDVPADRMRHRLNGRGTELGPTAECVVWAVRKACLNPMPRSGPALRPGSVFLSAPLEHVMEEVEAQLEELGINTALQPQWQLEAEEQKVRDAADAKAAGGESFKAKEWARALAAYEKSISLVPSSTVHANACLCLLKLNAAGGEAAGGGVFLAAALEHAQTAVRLEPQNVKAHYREGQVQEALGDLEEAADAYNDAAGLCGKANPNMDVLAALDRIDKVRYAPENRVGGAANKKKQEGELCDA